MILILSVLCLILSTAPSSRADGTEPPLPKVISSIPGFNARNVPSNITVTIVFSADMNQSTLTLDNIEALDVETNDLIPGDISYEPESRTLSFTPLGTGDGEGGEGEAPGFPYDTTVQFAVSSDVRDTAGNRLDGDGDGAPSDFAIVFKIEEEPVEPGRFIPWPGIWVIALVLLITALFRSRL